MNQSPSFVCDVIVDTGNSGLNSGGLKLGVFCLFAREVFHSGGICGK